jgi:acyl dehydratase
MTRWFEDIPVGEIFALGSHTFTAGEIVSFGARFDPQYFHLDAEAARSSHFAGLIASGWHTVCVGHRLFVDALDAESHRITAAGGKPGVAGPSPGVGRMVFRTPVRPGDTVTYQLSITGKRISKSKPGWGILSEELDATNQDGALVYHSEFAGFVMRRNYRPSLPQRLGMWMASAPGLRRLVARAARR